MFNFFHIHKYKNIAGVYGDNGYVGDLFECKCGKRKTLIPKKILVDWNCYIINIEGQMIYFPFFLKNIKDNL